MSAWTNALGAMLQTGGAIGLKRQEEARDAEIKRLADVAKEARDRVKKQDEAPSHFVTKRTGPGGATIEETNEQRWNPETQSYESRVISSYDIPAKEKRAETDIEFMQRDPEGYAKMHELERGPAKPSTPKEPKDTSAADAKDLNKAVDSAMNSFRGMDQEERAAELSSYGIDPAAGDARAKYENVIRSELTRRFSGQPAGEAQPALMKVPDEKKYAGFGQENLQKMAKPGTPEFGAKLEQMSTPEKAPAAPAAPGTKPAPAPYPDGTKLTGPDGKTYIVKNGEPVPYGG